VATQGILLLASYVVKARIVSSITPFAMSSGTFAAKAGLMV